MYCIGFTVLLVFDCVLHGFYRFVDISMCTDDCIVLLVFDCVLHGFYCFVDI